MNRTKDKTRRSTAKASPPQAGTNAAGTQVGTASGPSSTGVSNAVQNNSLTNTSGAPPLNRSKSTKLRPSNSAVNRSVASQPTVYHFQPVVITASAPGTNKASGGPPATAPGDVIELDPVVITADGSDDQQQPDGKKPKGGAAGAS